jgi:methyl-accepting chemotaxis protein
MTRTLLRTLLLATLAAPLTAVAQPTAPAPPRAPEIANDALSSQDKELLALAEQLASDASQAIDQWIITQATTEDRVFARLYFPIPKTDPQKFSSPYDALADRDMVPFEDKALARSAAIQYAIATDINGYVPAHNTRYAQPLSGVTAQDYVNNRASVTAARSEAKFLIQRVKLETGDMIYDLSVPIMVRGKHWGCARIGYRRSE